MTTTAIPALGGVQRRRARDLSWQFDSDDITASPNSHILDRWEDYMLDEVADKDVVQVTGSFTNLR